MKKISIILLIVMAFIISSCHFPGFDDSLVEDEEDAMATEIAKILTGTPVQVEPSPTLTPTMVEPEPTNTEVVDPEPEPTETPEPAEPTPTPEPAEVLTPTPTATLADTDPVADLGAADWVDNMTTGDNWPTGTDPAGFTAIKFEDGYLKLTALKNVSGWRVSWPVVEDFYLEATLKTPECEGSDHYGLMFRVPADSGANKGYLFAITCDGRYSLRRWDGTAQVMHFPISWTAHEAILKGENATNKLGVMARGAGLALYINGEKVNEVTDSTHLEGKFGIIVGGGNVDNLTVWVDQIQYWELP